MKRGNMICVKFTEHARKRAWQRFGWDIKRAKQLFYSSFKLEELPNGTQELPHNATLWVVNKQNDRITIITVRMNRCISNVFKSIKDIAPNTVEVGKKSAWKKNNKPRKLRGPFRV